MCCGYGRWMGSQLTLDTLGRCKFNPQAAAAPVDLTVDLTVALGDSQLVQAVIARIQPELISETKRRMQAAVKVGNIDDADRLIWPLVLAFASDGMVRWLFPDPRTFLTAFPTVVRVHANSVAAHGGAFYTTDFRGAALWYPPGATMDGAALGQVLERAVPPNRLEDVVSLFAQLGEHKPTGRHWYLRQIGVDPAVRGRGYGSELLRVGLEMCDRDGTVAYLEATSPANRRLYERFGFVVEAELQVGGSPPLWPMTRAVNTRGTATLVNQATMW
jgi:GNAT superfamily N-acetyltransferase